MKQQYLSARPFDLYSLHLYHLLVKHLSFTRAARDAGISQSAFTRQIQALEQRLGVTLVNRTTRTVEITEAGRYLAAEAGRLTGGVAAVLDGLQAAYGSAQPEVRVSVSRSMAMAHMPGLFHANRRRRPDVICHVSYGPSADILTDLEAGETDIGVLCPPSPLPETLRVTHRFTDVFELIAPSALANTFPKTNRKDAQLHWLSEQPWLLLSAATQTGARLRRWLKRERLKANAVMELDSFDLLINLVAAGFGISIVPRRALALYRRKESIVTLPLPCNFEREVVVLARKHRRLPAHIEDFIQNILF